MSDLKYFVETLRLSLYETLALLFPGAVGIVVFKVYFPDVTIPQIEGLPSWVVIVGASLIIGYILKGISAEAADKYRYVLLPWYKDLKVFGWVETKRWPKRQPAFFVSSKPLPRSFAPPLIRVIQEPLLVLFLWFYKDWREIRVANKQYKEREEFRRVKEEANKMFKLDPEKMKDWQYFSICYGAIPKEQVDKRDRLDATGDMLRGLIVLTIASAFILVLRGPYSWSLLAVLAGHWLIWRAFYNRVLRYDALAERNIYRAFFNEFCRVKEDKDSSVKDKPEVTKKGSEE